MTSSQLSYIALASRDVEATRRFLAEDLGLPAFDAEQPTGGRVPLFRVGRTALALFEAGDPFLSDSRPGIVHVALTRDDPEAAAVSIGRSDAVTVGRGLGGRPEARLPRQETVGVAVRFCPPLELPDATSERVERIDHIGIASTDNAAAEAVFVGEFGAIYESRQTDMEVATAIESFTSDKYGAVYHARPPRAIGGLRVSFLTVGDCELEFLQDFDPGQGFALEHGAPGTTKQDQSAIGRFIETRGAGLHHIAFKVPDIDAMLSRLAGRDYRLIDRVGRPGSRRARIGFVHPASTGGILFHFVERQELKA